MIVPSLHPAQAPKHSMPVSSYVGNTQQLTHQGPPTLEGLGTEAAQAFIPGSVGAGIIGGLVDKGGTVIKPYLNKALPGLGEVLNVLADVVAWVVEQANWVVRCGAEGVITYLPEAQANSVLAAMNDAKGTVFMDALKDALVAVYFRISPTNSKATDLKQGRDWLLCTVWEKVLGATGTDTKVTSRLADFIYTKAVAAGAKPYEAAAAAGYAQMVGTRVPSILPKGGLKDVLGLGIPIPGAVDGNKRISSVPAGTIDKYLAMVGPNPKREEAWLEQAFKVKSGGLVGNSTAAAAGKPPGSDQKKSDAASVLPYVAGGVVLLLVLSSNKKSS